MRFKNLIPLIFIPAILYSQKVDGLNKLISEVSRKYAPDKRIALFSVEVNLVGGKVILKGETNIREARDELIARAKGIVSEVVDSILVLPSKELVGKIFGVISVSVANIRANPSHQSELVNQLLLGQSVKILKRQGYWYLIQTQPPENYLGWIEEGSLEIFDKDGFSKWEKARKIIFTGYFGFVYSQMDENSIPVSDLAMGNLLINDGEENDWFKVILPDGRKGFVKKGEAKDYESWERARVLTVEHLVSTAKKFVGFPYLWGGTSVRGFDCSGFTKTVFRLNGLELPRDADQQSQLGIEVDPGKNFENLKPGDLLFFGQRAENGKPEKITHVGIYLGNKEFIHCSGKVSIDSFDPNAPNFNEYRYRTFLKAKRIVR